ncbi:protein grindelwald [Nylanderia fulva]|uniref:protein grindelwald n=1 Tax=Nylanderia fulva TaxID=613905 RepID=UPI0010FAD677|nr:protein grindelwald [Nylanderia fulva]
MFPDVIVNSMGLLVIAVIVLARFSHADLDLRGVKCGEKRCNVSEYCSPFDTHCKPCAEACDMESHNYQPEECTKDCQVYLHDQRYIERVASNRQYDDLREEVEKLKNWFAVTTTLTSFSLLGMLYLLGRTLIRWERIQNSLRTVFRKNLAKVANKNKDDVEAAANKQNGLKLTIPSISATVESEPKIVENGNSNNSSNNNGNSTTPNTTSTPLSRRYASEDTTLDYAYDNPAMTPSPEAAQLRTKARESSF